MKYKKYCDSMIMKSMVNREQGGIRINKSCSYLNKSTSNKSGNQITNSNTSKNLNEQNSKSNITYSAYNNMMLY